ncbi:MAG: dicarboxylate/amino acid:cation symporter, partial [Pseudomonadales bacterium]|nr:dicarboxylate/amino acid:cation symporter [Pseudomonadales bacterium]
ATVADNYARLSQESRLLDFLNSVVLYAGTVLGGLLIHFLIVLPLFIWVFTRVNPYRHIRALAPALLTAFSTASSSATLPVTMECTEQRTGVSRKISSFVLPLGATVNMNGSALYECVAAIFVVQAFGWELTLAQQFFIVLVALLTSVGVAGVPSASLVAIIVILQSIESQLAARGIDLPLVAGVPMLFILERPLDMCRTAVNIYSDAVGATVIAKTEGETGLLRKELLHGHEAFEEG